MQCEQSMILARAMMARLPAGFCIPSTLCLEHDCNRGRYCRCDDATERRRNRISDEAIIMDGLPPLEKCESIRKAL